MKYSWLINSSLLFRKILRKNEYKIKLIFTLALIMYSVTIAHSQNADAILGKYHLPNNLDIEIIKQNGKYFGKIIQLNNFENGQILDVNNPNRLKRSDSLVGMLIIQDLQYDKSENKWLNGRMYSPEKGLIFDLKIVENRRNEIVIVGAKYFIWKTLVWPRIID